MPTLHDIPTPALVIDEAIALANIRRLADYARKHHLNIRPHTKTHKSLRMAREQIKAGAAGLTAAKVGEAEVMASAGDDLLIAYPALDPARTGRIAALAKSKTLRVAVDSAFAADALAAAVRAAAPGTTLGVLVDIDVGLHRTGLQSPEETLALAQHVSGAKGLRLDGLFFYPGHITAPADQQSPALAAIDDLLGRTLALWKRHGLAAKIVSGGSTPTAYQSHLLKNMTEIRPGTYPYNDRNCLAGGWVTIDQVAARLIVTVVSHAAPGKIVVDSGSKTLSSDRLFLHPDAGGYGLVVMFPLAKITRLTEEHGEIDMTRYPQASRPKLGDRLEIIPNHICPCVNLQDKAWLRRADGSVEELPIEARGKLS